MNTTHRTPTMKLHRLVPLTVIAAAALVAFAGCSTVPAANPRLDDAHRDYSAAQNDAQTRDLAPAEMKQANEALLKADEAWTRRDGAAEVDHLAYLAKTRVVIARETGRQKAAEQVVASADAARGSARLVARTNEADAAVRGAEQAKREAGESQRQAAASQLKSEASERQTSDAEARARQLEMQLNTLNAKKTERGMVVTIGDVQFDTNKSQLKPDGMRSVEKLVGFLKQYPQRKAMVEGFTDSTGSAGGNQTLSGQRADAVRSAIVHMGVGSERVATHGYGEAFPVAANDSVDGRQSNRRVEVILSTDDSGMIAPR